MGTRSKHSEGRKLNLVKVLIVLILLGLAIVGVYFAFNTKNDEDINNEEKTTEEIIQKENESGEISEQKNKTIEEIANEFGGEIIEQIKSDTYYVKKDEVDYTAYLDGEIVSGKIIPWNGEEKKPTIEENGNITIYTAEELAWVANQVINGEKNFSGVTIILKNNIDLGARKNSSGQWEGTNWNSVVGFLDELPKKDGDTSKNSKESNITTNQVDTEIQYDETFDITNENLKRFAGTFDGNGYSIRGMNIDTDKRYQGLFGYQSGTISNLTIKYSNIKAGEASAALVGLNEGKIINCKIENTSVSGTEKIGGIAGITKTNSSIEGCEVSKSSKISANKYVGGLVRIYK